MLAGRSPEPFAVRLERRPGEREARFAHLLLGELDEAANDEPFITGREPSRRATRERPDPDAPSLADEIAELRARLDHLEQLLGIAPSSPSSAPDADERDEGGPEGD